MKMNNTTTKKLHLQMAGKRCPLQCAEIILNYENKRINLETH